MFFGLPELHSDPLVIYAADPYVFRPPGAAFRSISQIYAADPYIEYNCQFAVTF